VVSAGYAVMHTDCDVIWLRDPAPYLMCADGAGSEHAKHATFECAPLLEADVAVSSDNMSPGRDTEGRAGYSAGGTFNTGLLFIRPTPNGIHFASEWHRLVVNPGRGSRFAALTSDQQVFNNMMRKPLEWPGISAPRGSSIMIAWEGRVKLGALPLALFMNGHAYFVQAAHARLSVQPFAVHATYSLDNHDGLAKSQRFREAGLWRVDPPKYFEGKFVALNSSMSPELKATIDKYVRRGDSPNNIDVHATALLGYIGELRDALALAHALGRTLVLPQWTCYCDRLWSGSDDIFHFGCMYPGSQDGDFVPFVCPMDHVLSPTAWKDEAYRDARFLESSRLPRRIRESIVDLVLVDRISYQSRPKVPMAAALPLGVTDREARKILKPFEAAAILRLPHARQLLCGFDSSADTARFNTLIDRLLQVPTWCAKCYKPCKSELAKWLSAEQLHGVHGNFFCLQLPRPPHFNHASCVKNM